MKLIVTIDPPEAPSVQIGRDPAWQVVIETERGHVFRETSIYSPGLALDLAISRLWRLREGDRT